MRWRGAIRLAAALMLVGSCASSRNPSRPIDPSPDATIGHIASRPPGSVELTTLPSGWILQLERDVAEGPTGRWLRTWTRGGAPDVQTSNGKIDLYQAFGGPAGVTGGDEIRSVLVNGRGATLYRSPPDGELVLVWRLGTDGLALVVNETDFSIAETIKLAEGARVP